MRSFTPALIVSLVGVVLMIGAAVAWATSPPSVHHAKPSLHATVVITPADPAPVPVSFTATDLPIAALTKRGGQAT